MNDFLKGVLLLGACVGGVYVAGKAINYGGEFFSEIEKEENRRKNTECVFCEPLSRERFKTIVDDAFKNIKKRQITYSVNGAVIKATVTSKSGLSRWGFIIDFNNYGKINGEYWYAYDNNDSPIPSFIVNEVQKQIKQYVHQSVFSDRGHNMNNLYYDYIFKDINFHTPPGFMN